MVALGVLLHAIGGFAAGTFYLPIRKIRGWSWESGWLVNGVFSWLIAPFVVASLVVPDLRGLLGAVPTATLGWTYLFGLLWGIGGLTFGLSCRYLGLSLGYAVALGFCAFFGTIVPPIYDGKFGSLLGNASGLVLLGGLAVCLAGIAVCGVAGMAKERDLAAAGANATEGEFSFFKGVLVALFAGIMSACMSFAFRAGAPIAELATQHGVSELWKNTPVLVVILAGGFTTNALWCIFLNIKNRSAGDYLGKTEAPTRLNYLLAAVAGVTWYFQFMFYGMGTTKMAGYEFSSWTLHMAFIIVFSNLWAIRLGEWKATQPRTLRLILTGIAIVFLSTLIVGVSNYLGTTANTSGAAAETFDTDNGGKSNLVKFSSTRSPTAPADGTPFAPEWRDDLATGVWSGEGVTEQIFSSDGTVQDVHASLVAGPGARSSLQLKVSKP